MNKNALVLVGLVALGVALQTTAEASNIPRPPSTAATVAPTMTISPKPALAIVTDTVTAGVLSTSGDPILQGTWETMVKNQTSATYPVYSDPGKWKLSITCKKQDGTPSPKGASIEEKFFGVSAGGSIGRLGIGKLVLHVDTQGLSPSECVSCTMKREVTVGAKTFLSKSTAMPMLCKPAPPPS